MTLGISATFFGNVVLNLFFRATNATAPTSITAKLHTGDPGATGVANAAAGNTSRQTISYNAPAGVQVTMNVAPSWTNTAPASETLSHLSFWDQSNNFLGSCALASTQPWVSGNVFTLTAQTWAITPVAA